MSKIENHAAFPHPSGRQGCELFRREARAGWDVWGNQADKFTQEAS